MDEGTQDTPLTFDLSELTDFQFGPDWARSRTSGPDYSSAREYHKHDSRKPGSDRPRNRDDRAPRGRKPLSDKRPPFRRGEQRPQRELPQPAEGLRVELRPCNAILSIFATEIQRQKRALSLLDLARVVIARRERYDLVFMRQEGGAALIHSLQADGACWLSEAEALAWLSKAPWFAELYSQEQVEVEPPKGSFTGIAVCSLGGEIIGPVNWHGYQVELTNLYKNKYSHMPMSAFRAAVSVKKDDELVQAWLKEAGTRTVWRPTREGAQDTTLETIKAVEDDFREHHFNQIYETVDKVFINGNTPADRLSPGLQAHLSILSGRHRKTPQILIPNLCHGLARHHMPIFKWRGNHYTGPSRVRSVPEDMVLADRMVAILNWSKEHAGQKVDTMFAELTGVPAGTDDESKQAAADAYAPYTADMIWLMEQGFILVTNDNSIWHPKAAAQAEAPAPAAKPKQSSAKPKQKQKKAKKRPAAPAEEKTAAEPAEAPAEVPAAESAPAEAPAAEAPAPEPTPAPADDQPIDNE